MAINRDDLGDERGESHMMVFCLGFLEFASSQDVPSSAPLCSPGSAHLP